MRPVCFLSIVLILLSACSAPAQSAPALTATPLATQSLATDKVVAAAPTPLPMRQRWPFGDLLPYVTQSGDTLPALAAHFNATPDALQTANPGIIFPAAATLQPDQPLNIPANWVPLMGTPFQIVPDSEFVYGPGQAGFSLRAT
ncbi:MAG: LysM peptidoglycan-binding domain-containing protein, partial [Chloroflexi bacterium]|nr:LysM peptidoglycan-binding domain-containing protein [Chloroflexota bacterium]